MTKERAVIYLRVSTEKQTEQSQLEPCKKFCEDREYTIISVKRDKGKSAYKSIKRSGYESVIDMVKKNQVDHIVVWALDRWTRRGHRELMNTIRYLEKYNVRLHSVKEKWIDEITKGELSFVRDVVLNVLGWVAKRESQRKSERVLQSEKYQKAKDNKKVGRPSIIEQVENEVMEHLSNGKSYRWIKENTTYKAKNGKIKHPSIFTISQIKKMLENRNRKNNLKKS